MQVKSVFRKGVDYALTVVGRAAFAGVVPYKIYENVEVVTPKDESLDTVKADSDKENTDEPQTEEDNEAIPENRTSIVEAATSIFSMTELMDYDYVLEHFFVVPSVTSLNPDKLDLNKINAADITIKKNPDKPQILIFHTHGQESFADSASNGKTIVDVGTYLTKLLTEEYGYNVMHLTDSFDYINGELDRSEAYTYANNKLEQVLKEYPSIEVVIDLHRDGVSEDRRLVTEIDGKQTAQIMLFNGISYSNELGEIEYLYNPYITENLAMTYKMYLLGEMLYPDLIRCIYVSGYRYCLHHVPRSMLIEAGAQTNTYEEVYNAMEPLAKMLDLELTYQ